MKDLVGPGNVSITNCGNVIIRKVTVPDPDPTDTTFTYTTTGGLDPATFGLKNGESRDYGSEVFAGSYTVTEDDPSPSFALTDLDCSASDVSHGTTYVTDLATRTVSFDLKALDTVDCTYTNTLQQGALRILKESTKTDTLVSTAGAVFSYNGSSVTDNGAGDEDSTIGEVCVSGLCPVTTPSTRRRRHRVRRCHADRPDGHRRRRDELHGQPAQRCQLGHVHQRAARRHPGQLP